MHYITVFQTLVIHNTQCDKQQHIHHFASLGKRNVVYSVWLGWLGWACSHYVVCTVFLKLKMAGVLSRVTKHVEHVPQMPRHLSVHNCSHYCVVTMFEKAILHRRMQLGRLYQPFLLHLAMIYKTKCSNAALLLTLSWPSGIHEAFK